MSVDAYMTVIVTLFDTYMTVIVTLFDAYLLFHGDFTVISWGFHGYFHGCLKKNMGLGHLWRLRWGWRRLITIILVALVIFLQWQRWRRRCGLPRFNCFAYATFVGLSGV